jgi:hypothetical protein
MIAGENSTGARLAPCRGYPEMKPFYSVAVLIGNLRKDSINRKMAHALIELAPAELKLEIVEIGALLAILHAGLRGMDCHQFKDLTYGK